MSITIVNNYGFGASFLGECLTNSSKIGSICIILYASLHDSCLRWINGTHRCNKIYFIRYAHSTVGFTYLYTQVLSDNSLLTIDNDRLQIDK